MTVVLNQSDKVAVLREYAERYPRRVMIETGLYNGRGSGMTLGFERYIAIDAQIENVDKARAQGYFALHGDSGNELPRVLRGVYEPAFFWLDAHNMEWDDEPSCPLLAELDAILAWPHAAQSVVLIDDMRCMTGEHGFPTLTEIGAKCPLNIWNRSLRDDIARLTPRD